MNDLLKVIISLSIERVRATGLTDELEISNAANSLTQDAMLETPITVDGKEIRAKAEQILKDKEAGIESPYFPKAQFDMRDYYTKTVTTSLKEVFSKVTEYSDKLGRQMEAPTEVSDTERRKVMDGMVNEVLEVLNKNNVPLKFFSELILDMNNIITDLNGFMKEQVQGRIKEIVSRTIGAKHPNPAQNYFNSNFATFADLKKTTDEVREKTGGKKEDYFQDPQDSLE